MSAAAVTQSTLGIPKRIGIDMAQPKEGKGFAAGVIFVGPDGDILLLRRSSIEKNFAGHWALPGGGAAEGETPEEAADREVDEEIGKVEGGTKRLFDSRTTPTGMAFHTFVRPTEKHFAPQLNEEHTGYAWAPLHQLPQPLHPAVKASLVEQLGIDAIEPDQAGLLGKGFAGWARSKSGPAHAADSMAFDRATVRTTDADGRLHVEITNISKSNVCPYLGREIPDWEALGLDPEKVYQLYRDPAELEKAAPTFNNIPVLSQHVPVSAEDHQPALVVGSSGTNAEFVAPYLRNSMVVWAKPSINSIVSGDQKEISSAYRYRADMTPGTVDGTPYDGVMRDIIGNHLALVKEGRAGPDVVVGDQKQEFAMSKTVLTRYATAALGALVIGIRPKLAQDAKFDITPLLVGVTAKNFKDKKAGLITALRDGTKDKLAKDASIDDVVQLIDRLEDVQVEEGMDIDPSSGLPMADTTSMDNGTTALRAFLTGKLSEEDVAKACAMVAGGAADEDPDKDKEKDKDGNGGKKPDAPAVTKPAMDAAIKAASEAATAQAAKNFAAVREAEKAVRPYVGELAMAHDSADGVYRTALTALGVKLDGVHPSAFPAILAAQPLKDGKRPSATTVMATDSAAAEDFAKRFPETSRIGVA